MGLLALGAAAQVEEVRFSRLTVSDGLSHDDIHCVFQDRRGFLWIGLEDGVNRYDGREFKQLQDGAMEDQPLFTGGIVQIVEDRDNWLWLGSWGDGLLKVNLNDEKEIVRYRADGLDGSVSGDRYLSLLLDSKGSVWAGSMANGLNRYDPETDRFEVFRHSPDQPETLSSDRIWHLLETEPGKLWVGTGRGLDLLDTRTGKAEWTPLSRADTGEPLRQSVFTIVEAEPGKTLWAGAKNGLYLLDIDGRRAEPYLPAVGAELLRNREVRVIYQDQEKQLWVNTDRGGIILINPENGGTARRLTNRPEDPFIISDLSVKHIYEDKSRVLWIATASGLFKTDLKPAKFQVMRHIPDNPNSLASSEISSIAESRDGVLWIGSYGGGLTRYDPDENRYTTFAAAEGGARSNGLGENEITALLVDSRERLWIGGKTTGLYLKRDDEFISFRHERGDPLALSDDHVSCLAEDVEGRLWVGGRNGPNCLEDLEGKKFINPSNHSVLREYFGEGESVNAMLADGRGRFWVGAADGLFLISGDLTSVDVWRRQENDPASLSHSDIQCLAEGPDGALWVGTRYGLNRFDPATGTAQRYTSADGMSGNFINGVLMDRRGRLWIAGIKGLSVFDPANDSFRNYLVDDGLAGVGFTRGAAFQSQSGRMYFGGPKGLTHFLPELVKDNHIKPPIVLTGLEREHKEVDLGASLDVIDRLVLRHNEDEFTIKFAALDFTAPDKNQYRFRLVGLNDAWVEAGSDRQAVYNNLDPGEYEFQVKGSNNDGLWSDEAAVLKIQVKPPIWATWWAFAIYLVLGVALVMAIHFGRVASLQRRRRELSRLVAERTVALRAKNEELNEKNNELLAFDEIVQTINKEVRFEAVLELLIEQGLRLFRNTQAGAFLARDPTSRQFRFAAAVGFELEFIRQMKKAAFTAEEALARYVNGHERLADGVYLISAVDRLPPEPTLANLPSADAMLAMTIELDTELQGILAFHTFGERAALEAWDVEKLRRFRQHAITAMAKAKLVRDLTYTADHLKRTQELLTESARRSGMSEVAANTLHNVGNLLNSINVSVDEISDLNRQIPASLLDRVVAMISDHQSDLAAYLTEDPRGRQIPEALQLIAETLGRSSQDLESESAELRRTVESLRSALSDQERHIHREEIAQIVDLGACIEEALRIQMPLLTSRDVSLTKDWPKTVQVNLPKSKLVNVLVNLINNAADAMADSDVRTLTIAVRDREGGSLSLSVADTGCGIPPSNMKQLFKPGFSTKKKSSSFGLHYCANVMHEMGGEIQAHSEGEGRGAVFTLNLPQQALSRKTA